MTKLNAKELRDIAFTEAKEVQKTRKTNPLYLILENVYDTYNIGGIFRLADALAVEKIYLCGEMETPPNHKIKKASVGTYKIVPWEYKETALEAISSLRGNPNREQKEIATSSDIHRTPRNDKYPVQVIAVEQSEKSSPYEEIDYSFPLALLVGNETFGVLPETLEAVDQTVEIPMWGINKSLNVIVSAAIVSYHIASKMEKQTQK